MDEPNLLFDSAGLPSDQGGRRSSREQGHRVAVCRYGESMGSSRRRPATSVVRLFFSFCLDCVLSSTPGAVGSALRRVLFTLPPAPWITPSGICTLGLARSPSVSCSST